MNANRLRQEIDNRKPKYLKKYTSLMEAISNKGTAEGGDYIRFGPFYQTYMYAFMLGYHLGECTPISGLGESKDFAPISNWKPNEFVDYILMIVLSEETKLLGFNWIDLETEDEEFQKECVSKIIRRIEGYANTGLDYLNEVFTKNKSEFTDPFVFLNILKTVSKKK